MRCSRDVNLKQGSLMIAAFSLLQTSLMKCLSGGQSCLDTVHD